MRPPRSVPRLARRILVLTLPEDVRETVLADLDEVFERLLKERSTLRARLWYWREAAAFSARFLLERVVRADGPRGGGRFPVSWLDVKLGVRMLFRYPMLTLVGCMALAIGVGVTVGVSSLVHGVMNPDLDHPDADRIVTIVNTDTETSSTEYRSLRDFVQWREEIEAFEVLGAFQSTRRNLTGDVAGEGAIRSAIINASALEVPEERPLLGRTLTKQDERPGEPRVAVIGHGVWTSRFQQDPDVLGRVAQVDGEPVTIVGVMPEGFRFPQQYQMWEPFRYDPLDFEWREGPSIRLIGRLREGASIESAQAELDALARRNAELHPETHARLRPRVIPYLHQFTDPEERWGAYGIQGLLVFLLLIVCANVGLLILARTLARTGELAVRNAIGASRRRIIGQLFVETLVLSSVAAGVGLVAAALGIGFFDDMTSWNPFWLDLGLDAGDFAFAGSLAVLSALVAGVVPGFKATGRGLSTQLQRTGGGVAGRGFGLGSHTLVVLQVFFSVCLLAGAVALAEVAADFRPEEIDLAIDEYYMAGLQLVPETPPSDEAEAYREAFGRRMATIQQELEARVLSEPGVSSVTFAVPAPFTDHSARYMEVEGREEDGRGVVIRSAAVAPSFFDAFGLQPRAGRRLTSSDVEGEGAEGHAVVVTETFARRMFRGRDPIGERVRYVDRGDPETSTWHRIVGVVPDMWSLPDPLDDEREPVIYHPLRPGEKDAFYAIARAPREPGSLLHRMREIALDVEPSLAVLGLASMRSHFDREREELSTILGMVAAGFGALLALSVAGIYAMVSFTVTQRTREIGIRTALGAPRSSIAMGLVSRVMRDVLIGVALAIGLLMPMRLEGMEFVHLPLVGAAVVLTALATCLVPTRRGLRVRPAEALKADG